MSILQKETIEESFARLFHKNNVVGSIPTFLDKLDHPDVLDGGFPRKEPSIIAGPSGGGKTTLALNCAVRQANNGYKVQFLSLEMPLIKVLSKIIAICGGGLEKDWRIKNVKDLSDEEFGRIYEKGMDILKGYCKGNLIIDDRKHSLEEIVELMKEADTEGVDILYLDNFQLLSSKQKLADSDFLRIGLMSEMIREQIKTTNMAFIHLSQVTKTDPKDPRRNQIRNGQKLKDDAACLLSIYQKNDEFNDKMFVWMDKNRYGYEHQEFDFSFNKPKQIIGNYILQKAEDKTRDAEAELYVTLDELFGKIVNGEQNVTEEHSNEWYFEEPNPEDLRDIDEDELFGGF